MSTNQRFDLSGRSVIVTGGGKGIGKVYAAEFARAGARVVAADIDGAAAEATAREIVAAGGEAIGLTTDVASVRHSNTVFTPSTSAASRAAFSVLICWAIGTRTLPPR